MTELDLPTDYAGNYLDWQKYCGFLDLSMDEFKTVQEALLREQLDLLRSSPLWRYFRVDTQIGSSAELRSLCPITSYRDYEQILGDKDESILPEAPVFWAYTTSSGRSKEAPITRRAYIALMRNTLAALILASAGRKRDVNIGTSDRILYAVAPAPFLTGLLARGLEGLGFRGLPPKLHDELGFHAATEMSVRRALHAGCDLMVAPAAVALAVAQRISAMSIDSGGGSVWRKLADPRLLFRVAKARVISRLEERPVLPRDLWNLKGLVGWGIDMPLLRERIRGDWGVEPYEFMACTEAGILALQGWTKRAMSFVPTSAYFEFLPEREVGRVSGEEGVENGTVLLDGLHVGERYEVIVTSFYGMPFLRYRTGLLVRVVALADEREGIHLPQVELVGRSDGLIDLAGFTRLDERTIWDALMAAGIEHGNWTARRENRGEQSILALYIEIPDGANLERMKERIHEVLKERDTDYRDVEELLGINPLEIRPLVPGTFEAYGQAAEGTGIERDIAGRVSKTNAPQEVADRLVELSRLVIRRRGDEHHFLR